MKSLLSKLVTKRLLLTAFVLIALAGGGAFALDAVYGPILFKSYNPSTIAGGGVATSTNFRASAIRVGMPMHQLRVNGVTPLQAKSWESYQ